MLEKINKLELNIIQRALNKTNFLTHTHTHTHTDCRTQISVPKDRHLPKRFIDRIAVYIFHEFYRDALVRLPPKVSKESNFASYIFQTRASYLRSIAEISQQRRNTYNNRSTWHFPLHISSRELLIAYLLPFVNFARQWRYKKKLYKIRVSYISREKQQEVVDIL